MGLGALHCVPEARISIVYIYMNMCTYISRYVVYSTYIYIYIYISAQELLAKPLEAVRGAAGHSGEGDESSGQLLDLDLEAEAAPEPPAKLQKIERPSNGVVRGSDEPAMALCIPRAKVLPKPTPASQPLSIQARDGDDGNRSLAPGTGRGRPPGAWPRPQTPTARPRRLDIQRVVFIFRLTRADAPGTRRPVGRPMSHEI